MLRDLERPAAEVFPLGDLSFDLTLEHGGCLGFLPMSEKRAADPTHPLMTNVNREGVEL